MGPDKPIQRFIVLAAMSAMVGAGSAQSEPVATATGTPVSQSTVDPAAEAFVRSSYSVEMGGAGEAVPDYDFDLRAVSSARTAALFAEADALTPEGYIGYPEGHPLVEFEEPDTLRIEDVVTTQHGPDRADVALVLAFAPAGERLTRIFNLVKQDGRWRLDDLQYDQIYFAARFGPGERQPSLVEGFHRYIAEARANPIQGE